MNNKVQDYFEVYFAEKLWELIPPVYHHEDGKEDNPNPGVLRSFVELLAAQASVLRRSNDHLWDDMFIELCNDWAVPYIADLIGTRLLSKENKRGRKVDVAKTIYYRRRKGTLRILEELIRDVTGWDGKVVENFRRLGRTRHSLDLKPEGLGGLLTGTPPGGWANLRSAHGSKLVNGPFDEYHHLADFRQHRGSDGRYGITKLAFHINPIITNRIFASSPFTIKSGESYGFDPSGRSIPLFIPDYRPANFNWEQPSNSNLEYGTSWHSAFEWELASPVTCRLLANAEYMIDEPIIKNITGLSDAAKQEIHKIASIRFQSETTLKTILQSMEYGTELTAESVYSQLMANAITDDCGKSVLLTNALSVFVNNSSIATEKIMAGYLENSSNPSIKHKHLIIDPENGRFLFLNPPEDPNLLVKYHYGSSARIGSGPYDRKRYIELEKAHKISGGNEITSINFYDNYINQITDSLTYGPVPDRAGINNLALIASGGQRPFFCIDKPWILSGKNAESELCFDGIWLGSSVPSKLVFKGHFKCVVIRHCTIDPGGDIDLRGNPINPVLLEIDGNIDYLLIDSCITGPIRTGTNGHIENLMIRDSIIQSVIADEQAMNIPDGEVSMDRVTVFGDMNTNRLKASEILITGITRVTDTQHGCFRFSATNAQSRIPQSYKSHLLPDDIQHWFISRRFGQPSYAMLSELAPESLRTGSENGSEIGAYCSLIKPIKLDNLSNKIEEYMPFGLIPIFIYNIK